MEKPRKWRWGVNRWFVLLFIILGFLGARAFKPVLPHIQLPAEHLPAELFFVPLIVLGVIVALLCLWRRAWEGLLLAVWLVVLAVLPRIPSLGIDWSNTLTAMVIADLILLLIALGVRQATGKGDLVPRGLSGAIEALLEVIYNLTESTAGKWAKTIFPFFATITLFVLVVNWMELIPGVDSVGLIEEVQGEGHAVRALTSGIETVTTEEGHFAVVPFVRVLSTDLNFTVALALIAVIMTQVIGARALGARYFTKFLNVGGLFTRPIFGVIDFGVGILEMISEISKILSFSFRLFGNIFAGSVLLFVIGSLVPVFAQSIFLMLEFFVGLIQAFVFGMLTMVFMAQATQGHGGHDEHAEEMPVEAA